ncbi:RDD family protein [Blastopirellula marina]|uniref:RDD domain-containing protein n=1 Tax=Blastopirellula marina TaxID=124 RepID=A0A2S8GGD0_9BACT|nr:RDD family protein [Blastopirellula marina]PQO43350.1 hypothetical protein C5Y98_00095 [Blastopirellula marina]PTL46664.1 RDD family protein [Blastopirellula marina]
MDSAVEQNPFASPQCDHTRTDPLAPDRQILPSRWRRLFAALLDILVILIAALLPLFLWTRAEYAGNNQAPTKTARVLTNSADIFWSIAYAAATIAALSVLCYCLLNGYLLYARGQTIGKAIFKMKIVRRDGSRAGLMRLIFVRYVPSAIYSIAAVYFSDPIMREGLGLFGFGLGLAFLCSPLLDLLFIFTKEKRCLHDYLANTIVVKANPQ